MLDGRTIEIGYVDGKTSEVTTGPADLVALEAKYDMSALDIDGDNLRVTWIFFLAWSAAERLGRLNAGQSFEQWVRTVASVDVTDEDEETAGPLDETA